MYAFVNQHQYLFSIDINVLLLMLVSHLGIRQVVGTIEEDEVEEDAEVRGGGKKPYPQKKTGRARRGSQTTPLRPGGGVVFGPKPKDWSVKINKKEKRLAISTALASAAENAIVVEEFEQNFEKPKTKEFIAMMKRLGLDPKEKSMFLMTEVPDNVALSSRNIGTLKLLTPRTLNLFDILD